MASYLEIVTSSADAVSSYGQGFQKTFWCHLHPGLLTARTSSLDDLMLKQKKTECSREIRAVIEAFVAREGRGHHESLKIENFSSHQHDIWTEISTQCTR